jgi:DNA mismatch repair protein MutL
MAKINILSPEICNRIAAGEVIDRPYSVVKELVENSLDAGSTEIEIHIERGGKDLIQIIDNGCGIEKDDMRTAFIAHATSKISVLDDIDKITTLGFRGEALATICSVAQVELVSVTEGNEANKVVCDGEYIGKVQPAVLEKGTTISVRNLFFNTPARAKFMKTDKKEEADITNFVTRYILGNPHVAFKYYVDGKLNLQSYGGGLEEAIAQVYSANFLSHCFKIQADRNDIKIYGFIGNQNFFKSNKSYQSLFLNGRYIINNVISSAITNAYSAYAMKRQYPVYTLFVDVPLDTVDVNVHPNKADVRFVNNTLIYGTVYKVISSVLDGTAKAADFVIDSTIVPQINSGFLEGDEKNKIYSESQTANQTTNQTTNQSANQTASQTEELSEKQNDNKFKQNSVFSNPETLNQKGKKLYAGDFTQTQKIYDKSFDDIVDMPKFENKQEPKGINNYKFPEEPTDYSVYENYEEPRIGDPKKELELYQYFHDLERIEEVHVCSGKLDYMQFDTNLKTEEEIEKSIQQKIEFKSCTYKGELFNTYLLYEFGDDVYMIDQHAAHERLLYDKLRQKMATRKIARQGMLVPFIIDVNANENAFLESNLPLIRSMGFDIEQFGINSYRINEVPLDLQDIDLQKFFDDLLADINELNSIKLEDMLKDKIATTACKHAVKGGMELTEEERTKLFEMLDGNMGLKCPHGRPICVKLTKTQIEKMFKRIV